ncbi:MAG: N-formylglutamate amidohydrolase [Hirschia sp.]|nr:N-formylglutamate amidohydrolase [Hirschia sp.]MBF19066.1 N-formylglutamate amidohydrolase [Hirschia sp.]MBF20200.1 N-formylglutamate amidohydrolase [Hirschia sp.]
MHGSLSDREGNEPSGDAVVVLDPLDPTFVVIEPEAVASPLVFASPHSGRSFPAEFLSACTAPLIDLRRIEDAYVDRLFAEASRFGAPLICARVGRACLDLNRAPTEMDATMFTAPLDEIIVSRSPRVSAGLGCIPRIAHGGRNIYSEKLPSSVAGERLASIYHPYHNALDNLLDRAERKFGSAILIDCHSMPSKTETGAPMPDIVLGDRFGAACAPALTRIVEKGMKRRGYSIARNVPYAGGHITLSRGRPERNRHALQIEINRRLYLDEENVRPNQHFHQLKADLEACFDDVAYWSLGFVELST